MLRFWRLAAANHLCHSWKEALVKNGVLVVVLIAAAGIAFGQAAPASPASSSKSASQKQPTKPASSAPATPSSNSATEAPQPSKPSLLPPDATVITITGLCSASASPTACTTTISKKDFEAVANAVSPEMPAQAKPRFAQEYAQALAVAEEGKKLGVENDPSFAEQMKIAHIKTLAQAAVRKIQESSKPSAAEVETFYKENPTKFEELSLHRIYVPKPTGADAKPDDAKAVADKVRARAAAGEDPEKLEAEAYSTLKVTTPPPNTNLGTKRLGAIDARYEKQISALNPGQVTELLEDPQGFVIYKVDSKRTIPLDTVRADIENALQRQRFEEKMKQLLGSVKTDLNESYFGSQQPSPERPGATPAPQLRKPVTPPKN
jgi:parvulin-like peptidyl-prolyl isomerase